MAEKRDSTEKWSLRRNLHNSGWPLPFYVFAEIAILLREFTRDSCPVFYSYLEAPKFYWRDSSKHTIVLFISIHKNI